MSKPPIIFIVMVIVIVIAASFRYSQQRRQNAENDAAPLSRDWVTVVDKRAVAQNDRRSRQIEVLPAGESLRYEVVFRDEKGEREMTLRVSEAQYAAISTGAQGEVQYKGTRFIQFIAQ